MASRRHQSGVSMVEFALVSPLFFLVAIGLLVTGIVVTHQVQLTNGARDAARSLAVCGSAVSSTPGPTVIKTLTLPDGTSCTAAAESTYVNKLVHEVNKDATVVSIRVVTIDSSGTITQIGSGDTSACLAPQVTAAEGALARFVEIKAQYNQPLFLPLVGKFLGTGGSSTRTLTAAAQAQCEQ